MIDYIKQLQPTAIPIVRTTSSPAPYDEDWDDIPVDKLKKMKESEPGMSYSDYCYEKITCRDCVTDSSCAWSTIYETCYDALEKEVPMLTSSSCPSPVGYRVKVDDGSDPNETDDYELLDEECIDFDGTPGECERVKALKKPSLRSAKLA